MIWEKMKRPFCWFCVLLCILIAGLYLGFGQDRILCLQREAGGSLLIRWEENPEELLGDRVIVGTVCAKNQNEFTINHVSVADSSNPSPGNSSSEQFTLLKRYKVICDIPKGTGAAKNGCPSIGQKVRLAGSFSEYEKATNQGQFDSYIYYRSLNVIGRLKNTEILSVTGKGSFVKEGLIRIRDLLHDRIQQVFDEEKAGVMCAILLGEKSEVDKELKSLYRRNGIIHMLSVSGLHIGFLGIGLYKILRRILSLKPACVISALLMLFYGGMVGASISATRAIGMFLLHMLALFLGRTYDAVTALCIMALYTLLLSPASVLNSGFYLSYGSVLGLLLFMPFLEQKKGKLYQIFYPGISIFLITVPIQLWFLYEIPLTGLLINLLVVPGMTVVFGSGVAALIPGFGFAGFFATLLLNLFELLARWLEQFPYHMWRPGKPSIAGVILYYGCLLIFLASQYRDFRIPRFRCESGMPGLHCDFHKQRFSFTRLGFLRRKEESKSNKNKKIGALQFVLLALGFLCLAFSPKAQTGVTFLDVGQGLACVVTTGKDEVILYDCGSSSMKNPGEKILIPYLNYSGIRRINKVFLSHVDNDHVNGLIELLALAGGEGILLEEFVLPPGYQANEDLVTALQEYQRHRDIKISAICQGQELKLDGLTFHCLNPTREVWESEQSSMKSSMRSSMQGSMKNSLQSSGQNSTQSKYYNGQNNTQSKEQKNGRNEDSVCLYLELEVKKQKERERNKQQEDATNNLTILLTGDLEGQSEKNVAKLLVTSDLPPVQILQVAHHGSDKSSTDEFLQSLKGNVSSYSPVAIISNGRNNSYGHPHEATLRRLQAAGAKVLRTDELGQIRISIDKKGIVSCKRGTGE